MARQIGIKKLCYAKLLTDPHGGVPTFDVPKEIPQFIELSTTDNYAEYTFYSNDQIEESNKALTGSEVSLELGYLTAELESELLGKTIKDGKKYTSVRDVAPTVALMYEISKSDGTSDYRVLYKVTLSKDAKSNRTREDKLESSNVTLSGMAVPLQSTQRVDMEISDTSTDPKAKEVIGKFFTEVQL